LTLHIWQRLIHHTLELSHILVVLGLCHLRLIWVLHHWLLVLCHKLLLWVMLLTLGHHLIKQCFKIVNLIVCDTLQIFTYHPTAEILHVFSRICDHGERNQRHNEYSLQRCLSILWILLHIPEKVNRIDWRKESIHDRSPESVLLPSELISFLFRHKLSMLVNDLCKFQVSVLLTQGILLRWNSPILWRHLLLLRHHHLLVLRWGI
jgi:hypothetical protein